jgi:hypothetical protein
MASIIKLNYDCKALANVNYNRKHDATIWRVPYNIIYDRKTFIQQATGFKILNVS